MTKLYLAGDLMRVVNEGEVAPNCDLTLGLEIQSAREGVAKALWKVDERFLNGGRVAMGGFVTSAADITMAYAIASLLKEKQTFASINLQTTFHRPVFAGEVQVEVKVERMGRKVAYLVGELSQKEKVVASVVSSVMILEVEA